MAILTLLVVPMHYPNVIYSQCYSFAEIEEAIKAFIQEHDVKAGEWVVANNYDHNFLTEKAHPDRAVLMRISTDIPDLVSPCFKSHGCSQFRGIKKTKYSR